MQGENESHVARSENGAGKVNQERDHRRLREWLGAETIAGSAAIRQHSRIAERIGIRHETSKVPNQAETKVTSHPDYLFFHSFCLC